MTILKHGAILASATLLGGCASYLVMADEAAPVGQPHQATAGSYAWGAAVSPYPGVVSEQCAEGEQLARIHVTRNFGQGIITILTLGAVSPMTVRYYCASPPPEGGTIDTSGAPGD